MADDIANASLTTGPEAVKDSLGGLSLGDNAEAKTTPTTGHDTGKGLSLASRTVHADDDVSSHRAVAPAMHVSTTFKYNRDPEELRSWDNTDPAAPLDSHVYSRDSAPNTTRLEAVLSSILGGPTLTYGSGLAAFHALIVRINPRRIVIGEGYHGCHGIVHMMARLTGLEVFPLPEPSAGASSSIWSRLRPGDVIHIETPVNPTGEARNLAYYAARARETGAYLTVDATFAPPPLQDPLAFGADVVMHSGTKYFGGHSDLLCGVLTVSPALEASEGNKTAGPDADAVLSIQAFRDERLLLGSVMGSLEGWLGLRSLRTLELRVTRQSESAVKLVRWLSDEVITGRNGAAAGQGTSPVARLVDHVCHASVQSEAADETSWLRKQMPGGFGPVFSFYMKDRDDARRLPSKLGLFHHATSLGGVESLVEWRRMSDKGCDDRLIRVSIGVEGWEDLRDDFIRGFEALLAEKA